ncbi:hypothetical protein HRG_013859 [Hirsutella rhossiliensis]
MKKRNTQLHLVNVLLNLESGLNLYLKKNALVSSIWDDSCMGRLRTFFIIVYSKELLTRTPKVAILRDDMARRSWFMYEATRRTLRTPGFTAEYPARRVNIVYLQFKCTHWLRAALSWPEGWSQWVRMRLPASPARYNWVGRAGLKIENSSKANPNKVGEGHDYSGETKVLIVTYHARVPSGEARNGSLWASIVGQMGLELLNRTCWSTFHFLPAWRNSLRNSYQLSPVKIFLVCGLPNGALAGTKGRLWRVRLLLGSWSRITACLALPRLLPPRGIAFFCRLYWLASTSAASRPRPLLPPRGPDFFCRLAARLLLALPGTPRAASHPLPPFHDGLHDLKDEEGKPIGQNLFVSRLKVPDGQPKLQHGDLVAIGMNARIEVDGLATAKGIDKPGMVSILSVDNEIFIAASVKNSASNTHDGPPVRPHNMFPGETAHVINLCGGHRTGGSCGEIAALDLYYRTRGDAIERHKGSESPILKEQEAKINGPLKNSIRKSPSPLLSAVVQKLGLDAVGPKTKPTSLNVHNFEHLLVPRFDEYQADPGPLGRQNNGNNQCNRKRGLCSKPKPTEKLPQQQTPFESLKAFVRPKTMAGAFSGHGGPDHPPTTDNENCPPGPLGLGVFWPSREKQKQFLALTDEQQHAIVIEAMGGPQLYNFLEDCRGRSSFYYNWDFPFVHRNSQSVEECVEAEVDKAEAEAQKTTTAEQASTATAEQASQLSPSVAGFRRPDCLKTHLGRKFVITYTLLIELTSWALSKVHQVRSSKVERLLASTASKRFICLNTKARQGISHSHRLKLTRSQHLDAALIFIFGDQPKAPCGQVHARIARTHLVGRYANYTENYSYSQESEDLQSITPRQWQIIGRKFQEWVEIMVHNSYCGNRHVYGPRGSVYKGHVVCPLIPFPPFLARHLEYNPLRYCSTNLPTLISDRFGRSQIGKEEEIERNLRKPNYHIPSDIALLPVGH